MEAWKEEIARARLIAEIDRHPLFALPDEERAQDKELFSGLCSLVLKAKGYERKLEGRLNAGYSPKDAALRREEAELHEAEEPEHAENGATATPPGRGGQSFNLLELDHQEAAWTLGRDPGKRQKRFDGVAFMLAMKKAVEKYDGAKGSFLPYFNQIYSNMLLEQDKLTVTGGVKIDKRKFEIIKRVREVLEARYGKRYEIYKIPPHILNSVLEALVPPEAQDREKSKQTLKRNLEEALDLIHNFSSPDSLDRPLDEEDETHLGDIVGIDDDHEEKPLSVRQAARMMEVIAALCDVDEREFPRLFMTNDLLKPLKAETDTREKKEALVSYARSMLEYEGLLFGKVFIPEYLLFVLRQPPTPDSVRNLILAKLERKPNDTTIRLYKNCSKDVVYRRRMHYDRQRDRILTRLLQEET